MSKEISRRDFLRTTGKGMLGVAAVSMIPAAMAEAPAAEIGAPAWPWTYHKLDKKAVQDRAFKNFGLYGGCCSSVASAIIEELAEQYGYPYNQINGNMFAIGAGGFGNQNLCGALGGAFFAIGLFVPRADIGGIRSSLYAYYKDAAFPIYVPAGDPEHQWHSQAGSELCRDSVNNWMALSGYKFGDPERVYRCKCLSADVAGKTVELLNVYFGFEAAAPVAEEPAPELAANEYIGEGQGYGGKVKVKVTMDGDKIKNIEVLEHSETAGLGDKAMEKLIPDMIAKNSADVDAVTNATRSSEALIAAVKDALSKVGK
ncbi:MAG: FMN-binding protein [Clostridia bacterium]|nr:FMN-binding protein [Clostridia bacterium]